MSVLKGENLKKSYSRRLVVKGVDIKIESSSIVALLGRNGAGKTTTFQMIVGLVNADSGAIYLDKKNITKYPTHERACEGISYLPQESSVFLKTTVENNIKMILGIRGYNKIKQNEKSEMLLNEFGLIDLKRQASHTLSGGERRRLEICRSLALNPKFLLLDEPFTGIDPLTSIELQQILLKLKEKEIGIILSDHNVCDALKIADRAYIIDDGKILVEGRPSEVAADEKARERFLGKSFKIGSEIETYSSR